MIIVIDFNEIYSSWTSLIFSESMVQSTFRFICKDFNSKAPIFTKNAEIKNYIFWYFLSPRSKKFTPFNNDHLSYLDEIRLNVSEEKNNPDYWVDKYNSWLDSKNKLGRIPDCGDFKIPEIYKTRFSYDNRIANIP